jgi:hypothetical protein
MADWGNIAGGFNQGMQQNIKTISELQHMNLLNDKAEREKNVFDSWKKQEEENQKPIFLDNLPVKLGENVQTKLESIAETQGLINRTPDGRKFIRAKHGKELFALTQSPALLSEQMKDLTGKETELKTALTNTKKPEEAAAIQAELDKVLQGKDALSMQSKEFADMILAKQKMKILEAESAKKQVESFDQVKGRIAMKVLNGVAISEEEKAILRGDKIQRPSSVAPGGALVGEDGKVLYRNPNKPVSEPLVAVQDENGNTVYQPRSQAAGAKVGARPSGKLESELDRRIREKREGKSAVSPGVDINQERRWADEAIKAGKDAATIKKNFKTRTGKDY